jgi:hypothetical protein
MMGLKRRTVVEWMRCQSKFKIMWNSKADRFQIRDVVNNIAVGEFMAWDDAAEFTFDMVHGCSDDG